METKQGITVTQVIGNESHDIFRIDGVYDGPRFYKELRGTGANESSVLDHVLLR